MPKATDNEVLPKWHHLANINLFRELDGSLELTVAMGDGALIEHSAKKLTSIPIDYIEDLIIEAAANMKARRDANSK